MAVKKKSRKRNIGLVDTLVSGAVGQLGASAAVSAFKGKKRRTKKKKARRRNALFGPFVREMKSRERAAIASRYAPAKKKSKPARATKSTSSSVISEVSSALKNLGYGSRAKGIAEAAARKAGSGAGFDAVFRAAMSKGNPKRGRDKSWTEVAAEQLNMYKDVLERHERSGSSPATIKKSRERVRDAEKWLEEARQKDIAEGLGRRGFGQREIDRVLKKKNPRKKKRRPGLVQRTLTAIKKKKRAGMRTKKKNPNVAAAKAAQLYKDFHGADSTGYDEYMETVRERGNLAELGKLCELWLSDDDRFAKNRPENKAGDQDLLIEFPSAAPKVCADPDGDQLFLIGGDQNLDGQLRSLGITSKKDIYDLGPVKTIVYFTRKKFDGFDPVDYFHYFGEESKDVADRPHLLYDRLNRRMLFAGGAYKAKPEGITN